MGVGRKGVGREGPMEARTSRWRGHDWLEVGGGKDGDSANSCEKREPIALLIFMRLAGIKAMKLMWC